MISVFVLASKVSLRVKFCVVVVVFLYDEVVCAGADVGGSAIYFGGIVRCRSILGHKRRVLAALVEGQNDKGLESYFARVSQILLGEFIAGLVLVGQVVVVGALEATVGGSPGAVELLPPVLAKQLLPAETDEHFAAGLPGRGDIHEKCVVVEGTVLEGRGELDDCKRGPKLRLVVVELVLGYVLVRGLLNLNCATVLLCDVL